jgi:hypothetical protein
MNAHLRNRHLRTGIQTDGARILLAFHDETTNEGVTLDISRRAAGAMAANLRVAQDDELDTEFILSHSSLEVSKCSTTPSSRHSETKNNRPTW